MIPQSFGRYLIKNEIARGGMATVYSAFDPRFERQVAIKVLQCESVRDMVSRARFAQEAKIIASLEHPAIVPVYDYGEQDSRPYLVMRFMPGGTLAQRLSHGAVSPREAMHLLERVAPALDKAHQQDIVHRDLKPSNLLFDLEGNPYLSDFGIARFSQSVVTLTGEEILGTAAYMSPEQVKGERNLDKSSDIYALGVVLFEMLTGQLPYPAETTLGMAMRHVLDPVPSVRQIEPGLPPQIETLIKKAMAKERQARYASVSALAEAIAEVVSALPGDRSALQETGVVSEVRPSGDARIAPEPGEVCANCGYDLSKVNGPCPVCGGTRRLMKPFQR